MSTRSSPSRPARPGAARPAGRAACCSRAGAARCGCRARARRATASASPTSESVQAPGVGPVDGEHADHPVEDDDRRRERRARSRARAGPRSVLALETPTRRPRCDRPAGLERRGSRRGQPLRPRSPTGSTPVGRPLGPIARPSPVLAEADEAARERRGARQLLDGDAHDRVEIELRAHLARDRREQPLALERVLERRGRARPLERDRRLGRDRPQRAELLGRERAPLVRRRDDEHGDHPLAGDERDEGGAAAPTASATGLVQAASSPCRRPSPARPRTRRSRRPTARCGGRSGDRASSRSPRPRGGRAGRGPRSALVDEDEPANSTENSAAISSSTTRATDSASPARAIAAEIDSSDSSSRSRRSTPVSRPPLPLFLPTLTPRSNTAPHPASHRSNRRAGVSSVTGPPDDREERRRASCVSRFEKIGRTAYWRARPFPSTVAGTGRCEPRWFLATDTAVSTRKGPRRRPPEPRAFPLLRDRVLGGRACGTRSAGHPSDALGDARPAPTSGSRLRSEPAVTAVGHPVAQARSYPAAWCGSWLLASPRGYCAGVERAIETVERALELHGAPVYVRRQIVHNAHVVQRPRAPRRGLRRERGGRPARRAARPLGPRRRPARARARDAAAAPDDRRDLPLVAKVHAAVRAVRGRGLHHPARRPRRPRRGRRHARARRRRRRSSSRRSPTPSASRWPTQHASPTSPRPRSRSTRPPRSSQTLRRRFPAIEGPGRGRHLLRDHEPPARGQGARGRGRPAARDRLAELVQLEPPRRDRARRRRRGAPDRGRDRDRRALARPAPRRSG